MKVIELHREDRARLEAAAKKVAEANVCYQQASAAFTQARNEEYALRGEITRKHYGLEKEPFSALNYRVYPENWVLDESGRFFIRTS